jgi:hypothetical protein
MLAPTLSPLWNEWIADCGLCGHVEGAFAATERHDWVGDGSRLILHSLASSLSWHMAHRGDRVETVPLLSRCCPAFSPTTSLRHPSHSPLTQPSRTATTAPQQHNLHPTTRQPPRPDASLLWTAPSATGRRARVCPINTPCTCEPCTANLRLGHGLRRLLPTPRCLPPRHAFAATHYSTPTSMLRDDASDLHLLG